MFDDLTGWIEECENEWGYDKLQFVGRKDLPKYLDSPRFQAGIIDPEGAHTGTGPVEGAVFALFGLLVAFSFSGAAERFDVRRQLIVEEANAIGTAYLRIDLTPQPLAAVGDDGVSSLPASGQRTERRAGQRQLFQEHELEEQRTLLTAVRLGPAHAEPALFAERAHEGTRVRAGAVARVHALEGKVLQRVCAQEAPHLFGEGALVVREGEIHREPGL